MKKTMTITTATGTNLELTLEKKYWVSEANVCDGQATIKKVVYSEDISFTINGTTQNCLKLSSRYGKNPGVITLDRLSKSTGKQVDYTLSNGCITAIIDKETYDRISKEFEEMEAEKSEEVQKLEKVEFAKAEEQKIKASKEMEYVAQLKANGLCSKCGTFCHGDCDC